jgi:hypothetical protein
LVQLGQIHRGGKSSRSIYSEEPVSVWRPRYGWQHVSISAKVSEVISAIGSRENFRVSEIDWCAAAQLFLDSALRGVLLFKHIV